jgi:PiT family inorganic phosphate transporter
MRDTMATTITVLVGLATAVFVGVNTGGANTGVCFGPAAGARIVSRRTAQALMALFAIAGGLLVGPSVVDTLGTRFVAAGHLTPSASIFVLLFIGASILSANLLGVSVGTSQAAVGGFVGMGLALDALNFRTVGIVVTLWFVATFAAFWTSALIGRWFYRHLDIGFERLRGEHDRAFELTVVAVACLMGFTAGANDVANAVAPLVGSDEIQMRPGVGLAGLAIGAGAFLLGGRTLDTVGTEITEIDLKGSLVVSVLAGGIVLSLSLLGIPTGLSITMQACMGYGWGRTTRRVPLLRTLGYRPTRYQDRHHVETDRLEAYSVDTTRRIVSMWLITPVMAGLLAFATFEVAALGTSIVNLLVVRSELRIAQALTWLSGSTYAQSFSDVVALGAWLVLLVPAGWVLARQLDLLGLGEAPAAVLGVERRTEQGGAAWDRGRAGGRGRSRAASSQHCGALPTSCGCWVGPGARSHAPAGSTPGAASTFARGGR